MVTAAAPPFVLENELATAASTRLGWTVGAGLEHAFNKNWTMKVEYLYMDFGSVTASGPVLSGGIVPDGITLTHNFPLRANVVRVGVNYLFDSGVVVAKY